MSTTSTTSPTHCIPVWATINLYSTFTLYWQTFKSLYPIYEQSPYIQWITAMQSSLSPHVLPIEDLRQMLSHIEVMLPSTMHVPASSEDTLHFYRNLCTHILIANKQFLLLFNFPILNHTQQLAIYKVFTLDIPHRNFSAHYDINTKYLGITQDETMAVEIISEHQYSMCQKANGHFCNTNAPLQPLANPPSCIAALYTKNTTSRCSLQIRNTKSISTPMSIAPHIWILTSAPSAVTTRITLISPEEALRFIAVQKPIHILWLPWTCSATSWHFHLPPHYELRH